MAEKRPVVIYVDPEKESTFTIKPFAAGLATRTEANPSASVTASVTVGSTTDADVDADF